MAIKSNSFKSLIKEASYFLLSPFIKREGPKDSIYITFDDGPHYKHTLKIIEILNSYEVKATFFMNGTLMDQFPEIVFKIANAGHQIGYHSYHHTSLKELDIVAIYKDLSNGKKLLRHQNINEFLYRPPYGDLSLLSVAMLIFNGWKIIMWSIEGRDSFDTEEEILENLDIVNIRNGSVILLHDAYEETANLLPKLLEKYTHAGFNLNKLSYK